MSVRRLIFVANWLFVWSRNQVYNNKNTPPKLFITGPLYWRYLRGMCHDYENTGMTEVCHIYCVVKHVLLLCQFDRIVRENAWALRWECVFSVQWERINKARIYLLSIREATWWMKVDQFLIQGTSSNRKSVGSSRCLILVSHALNMSGIFGQSTRSIEMRVVTTLYQIQIQMFYWCNHARSTGLTNEQI